MARSLFWGRAFAAPKACLGGHDVACLSFHHFRTIVRMFEVSPLALPISNLLSHSRRDGNTFAGTDEREAARV